MKDTIPIALDGLRLHVAAPRVVAQTADGRCWFPDLLKFSTGELMLNYSLNSDSNSNQGNAQAVQISADGGRTWDYRYDVNGFHNAGGEVRVSLPDGRIVGCSTFLKPALPGQGRRFLAHRWTYDQGGKRYSVEPWRAVVEGLPRDVESWPEGSSRTWWSRINWFSDIVRLGDSHWITTLSMRYAGDPLETTEALISEDEGVHWRYLSTIAGAAAVPDATEGFDEPSLIQLADGDLMCVSRVGCGEDQKLARAYSSDAGKSWSRLDRLSAYSVAPQMCRLKSGVIALSTGRPGIFLWLSTDTRGKNWQMFDVAAHHNRSVPAENRMESDSAGEMTAYQTTAYTALLEYSDNRIFLVYDRTPFGWEGVTRESGQRSQIYLLELTVERT